jgi:hypothetical protein
VQTKGVGAFPKLVSKTNDHTDDATKEIMECAAQDNLSKHVEVSRSQLGLVLTHMVTGVLSQPQEKSKSGDLMLKIEASTQSDEGKRDHPKCKIARDPIKGRHAATDACDSGGRTAEELFRTGSFVASFL